MATQHSAICGLLLRSPQWGFTALTGCTRKVEQARMTDLSFPLETPETEKQIKTTVSRRKKCKSGDQLKIEK